MREAAIAYFGIGSHFGNVRSQNAKGHLLGHVRDLGLDAARPTARFYQTNERQTITPIPATWSACCACDGEVGRRCRPGQLGDHLQRDAQAPPDLLARLFEPPRRPTGAARCRPASSPGSRSRSSTGTKDASRRIYSRQLHRLGASLPRGAAADARADRGAGPVRRAGQRSRHAPADGRSGPATCSSCTTTPSCTTAPASRTGRSRSASATCCGCGWPPGRRPLPQVFAQRYGKLDAGDRGGIIVPGAVLNAPLEAV